MRESFVLIILLFGISVRCSNLDRDGFNIYKDHLRTRSEEPLEVESVDGDKMLYFYRAPLQVYLSHQPADTSEYRKRAANLLKNHIMNRLNPMGKRTSKAALSLMLQSKQDFNQIEEDHYCPYGK